MKGGSEYDAGFPRYEILGKPGRIQAFYYTYR